MRLFLIFGITSSLFACTDFTIQAQDGTWVNGRSLEFAIELQSLVKTFPRKMKMVSKNPEQKRGVEWVSQYGFLGVTALGMNFAFDGMNEAGLSFGYLWLPGVTQYPTVPSGEMKRALDFTDLGAWVLGNFATVAEVKQALLDVVIWGHPVPMLGVPPVHAAIHDAKGGSLVVEFIGGEMKVYENPIGVLTNSPPFDWQLANLQNYLSLSPTNAPSYTFRGVNVPALGQGSGLAGMPGDWTPPSRFVKIATLVRFATQPASGKECVNLATHLLNSVDIPLGTIRDPGKSIGDYTQWVVIKDLTQKTFYFRSYKDLNIKMIDLKSVDFTKKGSAGVSLEIDSSYIDVTKSM